MRRSGWSEAGWSANQPRGAVVHVVLGDISLLDVQAAVIAEETIQSIGQGPTLCRCSPHPQQNIACTWVATPYTEV